MKRLVLIGIRMRGLPAVVIADQAWAERASR